MGVALVAVRNAIIFKD